MARKYMKMCPTLLIIKEVQIERAVRYHFPSMRMTTLKADNNKHRQGCRESGILKTVGMKI